MDVLKDIDWPVWERTLPVSNKDFLPEKQKEIASVENALSEYFNKLYQIKYLSENKQVQVLMRSIVRDFIAYFYDLPASESYHHSFRFGLLSHCLESAYYNALDATNHLSVTKRGAPSAEQTRKERIYRIMIAWLIGLFHDAGKICDVQFSYNLGDRIKSYHILKGGILDFRLKFPLKEKSILKWAKGRGTMHTRRNMAIFCTMVPIDFLKVFPPNLLITLFDGLYSTESTLNVNMGDHESVKRERERKDHDLLIYFLNELKENNFIVQDENNNKYVPLMKLDNKYVALLIPLCINKMLETFREQDTSVYQRATLENFLLNNFLYSNAGIYFFQGFFIKKDKRTKLTIALADKSILKDSKVKINDLEKIDLLLDAVKETERENLKKEIEGLIGKEIPKTWLGSTQNKKNDKKEQKTSKTSSKNKSKNTNSKDKSPSHKEPTPGDQAEESNKKSDFIEEPENPNSTVKTDIEMPDYSFAESDDEDENQEDTDYEVYYEEEENSDLPPEDSFLEEDAEELFSDFEEDLGSIKKDTSKIGKIKNTTISIDASNLEEIKKHELKLIEILSHKLQEYDLVPSTCTGQYLFLNKDDNMIWCKHPDFFNAEIMSCFVFENLKINNIDSRVLYKLGDMNFFTKKGSQKIIDKVNLDGKSFNYIKINSTKFLNCDCPLKNTLQKILEGE